MNTCCNNIYPDEDLRRWEVGCSVPYYTKAEIDEKLENIDISGDCISSGDVQNMIDASVEPIEGSVEALSGTVGQLSSDLENKADRSEIPSLSGYATEQWVYINCPTKREIERQMEEKQDKLEYYTEGKRPDYAEIAVSPYYGTSIKVDNNNIDLYYDTIDGHANLNNSPIVNEDKAYEIAEDYYSRTVQADMGYSGYEDGMWYTEGNFRFPLGSDTPEYRNTLPRLEYKVTRYSGDTPDEFVISTADGTWQAKKGVGILRGFEVEGYQKTLSAGTGIAINGNVISATGGGSGITVDQSLDSGSTNPVTNSAITQAINAKADASNVYTIAETDYLLNDLSQRKADASNVYTKTEVNNVVNNKFWCGTQAEYNALVNKENGVLYLIYEV